MPTPHTSPWTPGPQPAFPPQQPTSEELATSVTCDPALLNALDTLSGDGQRELRLLERENSRLLNQLRQRRLDQT